MQGWGRTSSGISELIDTDKEHLSGHVEQLSARGGIARGLGRSYGDPAQNSGGHVIRLHSDLSDVVIDREQHTVTAGAGVSLDDLLTTLLPSGHFVPVTPGTRFVAVGRPIPSDIHGKNHHADGSFGSHVTRLSLMLADTSIVEVGPDTHPELFWATVGGMGLTGIILDATFRLIPVETSRLTVSTRQVTELDEMIERMSPSPDEARYSVAWLDLLATGSRLGRGVLTDGEHTTRAELPVDDADPLAYSGKQLASLPPIIPSPGVINKLSVKAFNELWFRKAPFERHGEVQTVPAYFHPLDGVGDWNRVYGRHGFVQYQFVVPLGADDVLRTVIERLANAQLPIFLTVLKRFGPGNAAPLSFPMGGWTLAIDIPAATTGIGALLHGLDGLVLDAGGRHYLAKDHHTNPEAIRRGYPRLDEWRAVRDRVDPTGVWASDLSRRLRLT